jgi:hypothetical protein
MAETGAFMAAFWDFGGGFAIKKGGKGSCRPFKTVL